MIYIVRYAKLMKFISKTSYYRSPTFDHQISNLTFRVMFQKQGVINV